MMMQTKQVFPKSTCCQKGVAEDDLLDQNDVDQSANMVVYPVGRPTQLFYIWIFICVTKQMCY